MNFTARSNPISAKKVFQKIALSISLGVLFVPLNEIIYLQAEGAYANFIVKDGKKIMASKKIKEFENILNPEKWLKSLAPLFYSQYRLSQTIY